MISKLFRMIFTLAALTLAVIVVINRDGYRSLIPSEFNPLEIFSSDATDNAQQAPAIEPQEPQSADSLMMEQVVDTLKTDTIKIGNN